MSVMTTIIISVDIDDANDTQQHGGEKLQWPTTHIEKSVACLLMYYNPPY